MFADSMEMTEKKNQEPLISIRDAARIIGVPPHTIRYWEKEFSDFLVAPRTMGKQRRYGDAQIHKLRTIFRMLKEEGYTIAGAKRALAKQNQAANLGNSQATTAPVREGRGSGSSSPAWIRGASSRRVAPRVAEEGAAFQGLGGQGA